MKYWACLAMQAFDQTWSGYVCRGDIAIIQACHSQNTLYTLHGMTMSSSHLVIWSTETQQAAAWAREFMEEWNLACFCVTNQDTSGNEVIAGAVSGTLTARHTLASPSSVYHITWVMAFYHMLQNLCS